MIDLDRALDELVPARRDTGDWDDVLERAGAERVPHAGGAPRRRLLLALAALGLLIVPAAIVAGVAKRTDVIFSQSKPAPNIVKKQFADLALGAPPRYATGVLPGKAHEVGTFLVNGRRQRLWIAPTRRGGFCAMFERGFGGCNAQPTHARILSASYGQTSRVAAITQIGGWIRTRARARIVVRYADGSSDEIPYVYVSAPIRAGFFWFDVPDEHVTKDARATEVDVEDATGRRLERERLDYRPPPRVVARGPFKRAVPRKLPKRPPATPTPPLQRATAHGVSVVVGANGAVRFDATGADAETVSLLGGGSRSVSYNCFKLSRVYGIFDVRALGVWGRFQPSMGTQLYGLKPPLDGCDIQGSYGHRWPDRNGNHSAVELPLTPKGRSYFADRAAARDLALFVRSRRMQAIRDGRGASLTRALRDAYGDAIVRLDDPGGAAVGRVGYVLTANGAVFVERSATRRLFKVNVYRGRITSANVKPYAYVF